MILSPEFPKKFKDIFGDTLLVAVPNRYTVLVFPALASNYKDFASLVLQAYHDSAYPVSTEVFQVTADGIKAIGEYEE
jgi:hypothetical protein